MKKIAIALLLGSVFAMGCGDKATDGAKSGSAAAAASGKGPGGASCEAYWKKKKACDDKMIADMPEAGREMSKKTIEDADKTQKDAWGKMEGSTLESACKISLDALAQNPTCPK